MRTPGAEFVTAQWRLNNTIIAQEENSFVFSGQNGQSPNELVFSLIISAFNPLLHYGTYEVLVRNLAGVAVSATWELREPGECIYVYMYAFNFLHLKFKISHLIS